MIQLQRLFWLSYLFFLALPGARATTNLRLPAIFGDHMVLQADMPVRIWGWAAAGHNVTVGFRDAVYSSTAGPEGKWSVQLGACKSGGPYEMSIGDGEGRTILHDIFVGDVWLASGQSNMEFGIQTDSRAAQGIAGATDSLIRFFYVPMARSAEPLDEIGQAAQEADGKWVVCSPSVMASKWAWHGFSAVGYYFARRIRALTHGAVGVIGSYKGGTPAQSWVRTGNYFNAMIHPLIPYSIKGVVWYQGESNGDRLSDALHYRTLFPTMINDWRTSWGRGDLPFLFVQLPNFRAPAKTPSEGNWPWVREAQRSTLSLPNTGMAVAIDLGTEKNIHPWDKSDVADRLAQVAMHVVYKKNIDYTGPEYDRMHVEGSAIRVYFRNKGKGLTAARWDSSASVPHTVPDATKDLKGFAIAGEDSVFVWAKAVLDGRTVVVSSDKITKPVAVRYDWADNPAGNLYDNDGLPAPPFRTDDWTPAPEPPHFVKHVLTSDFVSEGVAIADVNGDGKPDILAGAYWFEAPSWTKHEIFTPSHYDPSTQFSNSFLDFALDVDQDGWVDMIRISLPGEEAVWYQNPGGNPGHWPMHPILKNAGNESPAFVDVDGDGRKDILCNDPIAKEMIWMKSPVTKGDTTWTRHVIAGGPGAPGTGRYTHGLGFDDMNGDGRPDVIITKGWWEHPVDAGKPDWVFHAANLGEDCSQIYVLNGVKGRPAHDLVSASAHNYGIWWHEKADTGWLTHVISKDFSETHALAMADVNADGYPDLVTGKRYYAHNGEDPGAHEPSVLYWFEFRPGPGPMWIPHLIDSDSGVGLQVLVQDLDGNGTADIIVSNKKGVFFFEQKK